MFPFFTLTRISMLWNIIFKCPLILSYKENDIENELEYGNGPGRAARKPIGGQWWRGKRYGGEKSPQCPTGLRRKWMYTTFFNFRSTTRFVFTMPWISGNNTWIL
jgi:hypothetical protein